MAVSAFLLVSVGWMLVVNLVMGVLILVPLVAAEGAAALSSLQDRNIEELISVKMMGFGAIFQFGGLVVAAAVLAKLQGRRQAIAFAIRRPLWIVVPMATIGGFTVGVFPGWMVEILVPYAEKYGLDTGSLDLISSAINSPSISDQLVILTAVCISAPILEELIFRGFLWDALSNTRLKPWAVWLITSFIFAFFHLDPLHVFAVTFTGLFLGWLRWMSQSIWPSIFGHFVNNALAAALVLAGVDETANDGVPVSVALSGAAITLLVCVVAWFATRRARSSREG